MSRQTKKAKPHNKMLDKFIKVFLLAFSVLIIVTGIGVGIYILLGMSSGKDASNDNGDSTSNGNNTTTQDSQTSPEDKLKKITTFAIFGLDKEGYRTDVVMLLFFNKETKKINIISVPRDTMISIPDDMYQSISARRSDVPKTIKVNEIPAYVDSDERNESSAKILEGMFGCDIDYYMTLNLEEFKNIVDVVGPIEVNIPFDMVYSDPTQNLYINLKKGVQELHGAQAEELIRYRKGYGNGDLGRIDMQHEFMKAFLEKLLTVQNKMNIVNIAASVMLNLDTNFKNAIDYVDYIDDISADNVQIDMLPGEAESLDRSYYIYDYDATKQLLNSIFNDTTDSADTDATGTDTTDTIEPVNPETVIDIKTLTISVQNGTTFSGFASGEKAILENDGYKVSEATDYSEDIRTGKEPTIKTTKLMVPTQAVGDELKTYFNNPVIEVDKSLLDQENQVIIILGENDHEQD